MYFGEDRDTRIDDIIIDIAFFSGTCYSCDTCLAEDICPLNYTEIIYKVSEYESGVCCLELHKYVQ